MKKFEILINTKYDEFGNAEKRYYTIRTRKVFLQMIGYWKYVIEEEFDGYEWNKIHKEFESRSDCVEYIQNNLSTEGMNSKRNSTHSECIEVYETK